MPKPKTLPKIPRYTPYQPKLALIVCYHLAMGDSLLKAAAAANLQTDITIYNWILDEPEFATAYERAKEIRARRLFDSLIELADTANADNAQAIRLQVDTRKWALSKMLPREYGDKITTEIGLNQSLEQLVLSSIKLIEMPQNDGEESEFKRLRQSTYTRGRDPHSTDSLLIEHLPADEPPKRRKRQKPT